MVSVNYDELLRDIQRWIFDLGGAVKDVNDALAVSGPGGAAARGAPPRCGLLLHAGAWAASLLVAVCACCSLLSCCCMRPAAWLSVCCRKRGKTGTGWSGSWRRQTPMTRR